MTRRSAKQSLGQHFLMHRQTAERIVEAAGVTEKDAVLEIGPGTGMLTRALSARVARVVAVEADAKLLAQLRIDFSSERAAGTLTLIEGDIRDFDPSVIEDPYHLVANIPYYITGELIRRFLEADHAPESMTLLVQKEVAERIARGTKESLLSLSVKAYGSPKYRFTVPKGAFVPAPNVDSAVLSIIDIRHPFATTAEKERFFGLLHAGFAHKRKRLAKNLETCAPQESVVGAFTEIGLPLDIRAEDVPLSTWLLLTETLHFLKI